ncbi:MAG: hypothetical protein E7673_01825 [Ruminococcaceae bacterium]|nr:hypothetical protein [Oscillospiraceae bacterium]
MIVVKKKMKKSVLISILAGVLAVLIAGAIIVNTVIASKTPSGNGDSSAAVNKNLPSVREELGEYDYGGVPYAFFPVEREQMEYIQIRTESLDKDGNPYTYEYSFLKEEKLGDAFVLSYTDKDGNTETYLPPILSYDSESTYSSLYATEQSTGYDIPMLFWLCSGIGNLKFSARVDLSSDKEKEEKDLKAYGLSESDSPLVVRFNYKNKDGKSEDIVLQVGDALPTGGGYYFRVGAIVNDVVNGAYIKYRPCVYTTYESSLSYAFLSFADYINPTLVAEGLPSDNAFEPYLTTDFKQWKNTPYIDNGEERIGYEIPGNAHIILVTADKTVADVGGGFYTDSDLFEFVLTSLRAGKDGRKLYDTLKLIKKTGILSSPLTVTLPSYARVVDLGDEAADQYTYEIIKIDAILGDTVDTVTEGAPVSADDKVKVTYNLRKNGTLEVDKENKPVVYGGVIDLSSELIPDSEKNKLIGMAVGEVSVSLEMTYTDSNVKKSEFKLYIDEIIDIRATDNYAKTLDEVQVGATVSLRVYDIIDGERSDTPYTLSLDIKEVMDSESDENIKKAILGEKKTRGFDKVVKSYVATLESMQSYVTYEIKDAQGFITREEIVSFRYTQNTDRNVYYGESIYTNTMEDAVKRLYALEANSCESVVQLLGGLLENASHSEGLVGLETVDVVITPKKMIEYGLYKNTLYFELPRNILPVSEDSEDYTWLSSLGFTLYVSDVDPATKTRYIASDLYDIVAKIDAKHFDFLDESFLSLYARKNLVLTGIENIHDLDIELFLDEFHGTFKNVIKEYKVYGYNDKVYGSLADIQKVYGEEAIKDAAEISMIRIRSDYEAHCAECQHKITLLEKTLGEGEYPDGILLDELYGGKMTASGADFLGSDSFKEFIGALFFSIYEGELTEENLSNVKEENLIMRMSVGLGEEYTEKYEISRYVYEFYKVSDRRIAVRIYQEDENGNKKKDDISGKEIESADFYVSSFAFKKLVSKYWQIVNAIPVSKEEPLPDYDLFG